MTTKRSRKITPKILELYRRARVLHDQDPEGYHASEAWLALEMALGQAPCDFDIFEALDKWRDTEITTEMINATRGACVIAQWGLRKDSMLLKSL
jgi:hypothetical protein